LAKATIPRGTCKKEKGFIRGRKRGKKNGGMRGNALLFMSKKSLRALTRKEGRGAGTKKR